MIKLTKLDGGEMYLNPDQIEIIEETPDTHITLLNGNRYLVREKIRVIVDRIVVFKARIVRRSELSMRQKHVSRQNCNSPAKEYPRERGE